MTDVDRLLGAGFEELGREAPHDADLAGSVRRRGRRQLAVLASALAVVVLAGAAGVAAVRLRTPAPAPAAAAPVPTVALAGCPALATGPLPEWARTGFSGPDPGIPFARSRDGRFLAIVFGNPLSAPSLPDRSNKILWVLAPVAGPTVEPAPGQFWAQARLEGTGLSVRRDIGSAPGPSIVDLPRAGCWQLELHWGSYTDSISLRYRAP
ncbi:MAG TPA: hypothetical protein VLM05_22785 [Mycobacteriales bacterium]|nr:hypothetical protein [Mycobacteriales bacterium]